MKTAKADLRNDNYKIVLYTYRPFDLKYIYYLGCTKGIVAYPRRETMEHMIKGNIGLCLMRQFFQCILYNHVFISENIIDERTLYSNRGGTYLFPLYLYSSELGENKKE